MIRSIFAAISLFLPLIPLSAVSIESAYTRYYEAGEIRPIRQYFGASLRGQGFRTVIASQPTQPEGQYFLAKLEGDPSENVQSARLTIYPSTGKDPWTFSLELGGEPLRAWLYLGLTGSDWPDRKIQPMAWKIELLGAGETLISEWKSFLWEMP